MLDNDSGFTITELLIVIVATGVMSAAILTFTFQYWRYSYALQSDLESLTTRLNAGDSLRTLIGSSTGFIIQTSLPDDPPLNPDPNNAVYWEELHATPTTYPAIAGETTPVAYFKRMSFDAGREIIFNGEEPYEDEYVLYINGDERALYLRSIANPNAPDNALQSSCEPASASPLCPADRIIAEDVSSVAMRYFSRTGNSIDYTSITDDITGEFIGPDFTAVEVAELTISITGKPLYQQNESTQVSTVIRVALRN
jgi:prepilin-type N-terminal cleavage/methylation domain-containing protein